jgi:bifunctional non-homologous end joining protein LigD
MFQGDAAQCSRYHRPTMTDQLSLRFEPALPRLPTDLRPMLAQSAAEPFDSAKHLFEPSWGGERALAFIETADGAPFRLMDEDGKDLAALLPELADLPSRVMARSAVIDGELVVVDATGRADPDGLAARLHGEKGPAVSYLVFDLLVLDGKQLIGQPLARRRQSLKQTLTPGDMVVAVPAIVGEGLALHAAVRAQGIAATVARVLSAPYLPGVRSRLWLRIEATPVGPAPGTGKDPAHADQSTLGLESPATDPTGSPVLAVIRRLPLEWD